MAHRYFRRPTLIAPLIAAALLVAACTTPASTAAGNGATIAVLGTENFYADLLTEIGGSRVNASSLLNDPTADPHEFEASPKAAAAVADAKLVIINGIGYDDFMLKLLAASPKADRVLISVQELLGLKGDVNAHIWYDPATMPKLAEAVAAALAKLDPQGAKDFETRKRSYLDRLKPIDTKVAALKAKYAGTPVAFTEPVAEYLTEAIGLTVLTPKSFQEAIEQGVDPSPADVAAERDLLTGKKVKLLFYNSQVTSPLTKSIQELAVKNGIPVVGVAETIPPEFKGFAPWMLAQLDALERALAK